MIIRLQDLGNTETRGREDPCEQDREENAGNDGRRRVPPLTDEDVPRDGPLSGRLLFFLMSLSGEPLSAYYSRVRHSCGSRRP
jgi:hypothetical protein